MPARDDFDAVFAKLRAILKPFERRLEVLADVEGNYSLNTRHIMKNKQPLFFAGVRTGKAYVSFHLMPVYACPELLKGMSPELKKRMQGKSCFNFKSVDEKQLKELSRLTKAGFARFNDEKFIQAIRKAQGG
jgi:hypothetical protein